MFFEMCELELTILYTISNSFMKKWYKESFN